MCLAVGKPLATDGRRYDEARPTLSRGDLWNSCRPPAAKASGGGTQAWAIILNCKFIYRQNLLIWPGNVHIEVCLLLFSSKEPTFQSHKVKISIFLKIFYYSAIQPEFINFFYRYYIYILWHLYFKHVLL